MNRSIYIRRDEHQFPGSSSYLQEKIMCNKPATRELLEEKIATFRRRRPLKGMRS
jgi:hypothetical protein